MRRAKHFGLTLLVFTLVTAGLAGAQQAQSGVCDPPRDTERLSQYLADFSDCLGRRARQEEAGKLLTQSKEEITAKPSSVPSGDGFGTGIRDTIEDFLPLFGGAIDSVSTGDDDRSVTVRLNPIRAGELGSIGLSVAATEPEPGEGLINSVPEAQRAALREIAENRLDDLANLTYTAKWGYERKATLHSGYLFGRSPENYRPIIEERLMRAIVQRVRETDGGDERARFFRDCRIAARPASLPAEEVFDVQAATIGALRKSLGSKFDECLRAWKAGERRVVEQDRKLDALAILPYLIDNQPQLVLSAAVHDRDPLVGRDGWEVEVSYEHGFQNFNTLLGRFRKARTEKGSPSDAQALAEIFWETAENLDEEDVEKENKLTLSIRYAERDRYRLDETFGEGEDAIPVAIDLPEADDWCVKLEWHRNATWQKLMVEGEEVFPRLHLSGEYVDVSDDPMRQDRLVATFTYELPVSAGTSVPLSLTYANHSEFLGEPDEQLSAHLGFSYKLPGKEESK